MAKRRSTGFTHGLQAWLHDGHIGVDENYSLDPRHLASEFRSELVHT
jgi:hypothetical protein